VNKERGRLVYIVSTKRIDKGYKVFMCFHTLSSNIIFYGKNVPVTLSKWRNEAKESAISIFFEAHMNS